MEDTHDESLDLQQIRSRVKELELLRRNCRDEPGESSPSSNSGTLVQDFALQLEMFELESKIEEKRMILKSLEDLDSVCKRLLKRASK